MIKSKRKKLLFIALIFSILVVGTSVTIYFRSRVYWKYNDHWIIGKQKNQIVERYGEFDRYFTGNLEAYAIENGDRSAMIADNGKFKYYYIHFDETDTATKVSVAWGLGG